MGRLQLPWRSVRQVGAIFFIAFALNYVWEIAQAPLYAGTGDWGNAWLHCLVASLGDGILVSIIYAVGSVAFRCSNWYLHPTGRAYGLMLASGFCIGVAVEWAAILVLNRWAYASSMPLIPGLGLGLVPVLQMLLVPPLIFRIAAGWSLRK